MTRPKNFSGTLSTLAGIVINIISVLFIRFHNKAQNRSILYFNQLVLNQQLGLAIRLAASLGESQQVSQKEKTIKGLLGMIEDQAEIDLKRIDAEALSGNGKRSKTTVD